jgi:4-amino-4-deoxy-L-arabinose transferase-like glycosyltransferase
MVDMMKNLSGFFRTHLVFIIICCIFLVVGFETLNDYLLYNPDSARYIAWANSLAHGKGFLDQTTPEPSRYVMHAPLYSLFLTPVAFFFQTNESAHKAATILLGCSLIVLMYSIVYKESGKIPATIAALLLAVNPLMIIISSQVLSDVLFGVLLLISFWLLERILRSNTPDSRADYLLAVVVTAAVLSREIGIILVPLVCGALAVRRQTTSVLRILLVFILCYGAWYIWNEIHVARIEGPVLSNQSLLFQNVLTSPDDSFFDELLLRWKVNGLFYSREIASLLFFPFLTIPNTAFADQLQLIDRPENILLSIGHVFSYCWWFFALIAAVLVFVGLALEYRSHKDARLRLVFVAMYAPVLLSYPVTDKRFLFPLLLVFILWAARATTVLLKKDVSWYRWMIPALTVLLLVPNISWSYDYVKTQHAIAMEQKNPQLLSQYRESPFRHLGHWLDGTNDSSAVVLSRYKELALFMKKRTVVVVDVFVSLERFEQLIRDYGIHYLVMGHDAFGWRELEMQMALTDRYSFQEEYSAGYYTVYSVHPPEKSGLPRNSFDALLRMIKKGDFRTVDSVYYLQKEIMDSQVHLLFLEAIAKEGLGQLDSASLMMEKMYTLPQGIVYSQEAGLHRGLIEWCKEADAATDINVQTQLLNALALHYWECDLRWMALSLIHRSIAADSDFVLPYFYGIDFSLATGDTNGGKQLLTALQRRTPDENMVHSFAGVFSILDSLRRGTKGLLSSGLYFRLADKYEYLTLTENEISALLDGLRIDPANIAMTEKLALLYESKERYFPALRAWRKAEAIAPSAMIQEKIREIEKRY